MYLGTKSYKLKYNTYIYLQLGTGAMFMAETNSISMTPTHMTLKSSTEVH